MTTEPEKIGYAWSFIGDLGNGKQISMSGNFLKGTSLAEMNAEVDKINSVIDRQQAKAASVGVKQEIGQTQLRLKSAIADFTAIEAKSTEKGHLSVAERQQREIAANHITKMEEDLAYRLDFLKELEEKAK